MNSIFMNQQQTKTIKYLNKGHLDNEPSENDTEKLHDEQLTGDHKKKVVQKRANLYDHDSNQLSNRIYMMDRSDRSNYDIIAINSDNRPKNRHHKGKSLDINEQKLYNKKQSKIPSDNKHKNKKVTINNNYLKDLRQRNSISQVNHYNFSKKIQSQYHKPQLYSQFIHKEKKSKEIFTNAQIKNKKNQDSNKIKGKKVNKTSQDKKSKHSEQFTLNCHKNKPYSKSYQIKTQRKVPKSIQKQQKAAFLSQIKKTSFTMPLASKNLIQIYSNNSSLYNSYQKLQVLNRDNSYIIPTQLSFQLDQIRQYESSSINIRSNKSLRKLKKISIIKDITQSNNSLEHQIFGYCNSTQEIISNYINLNKSNLPESNLFLKDIEELSIINQPSLQKESSLGINDKNDKNNKVIDVIQQKSLINSLESEISVKKDNKNGEIDLNSIINIIKKSENSTNQNKMMIVSKIKQLILEQAKKDNKIHNQNINFPIKIQQKNHEHKQNPHIDINIITVKSQSDIILNDSNLQNESDLNINSLKQSLQSNETLQNMNLDILDKTLRQRQLYLYQKKQKQLLKLYENKYENQQQLYNQINNFNKWMDHQITQVQHTRKQLWKGFNLAKELIYQDKSYNNNKHKQIIKCLSDKYINKKNKKINKQKVNNNNNNNINSPKGHNNNQINNKQLQQYKIKKESKNKKQKIALSKKVQVQHSQQDNEFKFQTIKDDRKYSNSDIDIDASYHSDEVSEDQLLYSSGKIKDQQQIKYRNNFKKQTIQRQDQEKKYFDEDSDNSIQNNAILSQATQLQVPIPNIPDLRTPSLGINIQKIQCQIEQQDSFTEQQLLQMSKQSEKAKNQSMKLPKHLSLQDKEDIYEFIFLDLCIQLTDEYNQDTHIMKKIQSFIKNIKEQSKKAKGFKTNSNIIKQYLFQFITFLKNKPQYLKIVHLNLDKPLGPTAIDILKYMHVYDDQQYEDQSNQNVFILDIQLFQKFQEIFLSTIAFQKYYNEEEKQQKRIMFLKNAVHIHNKAIFDALNEILDKHRPYGVWGQPFSWKKAAKFYHAKDVTLKNNVILQSVQRIIDNSSYMCGFMIDKQDCNLKNNPSITQAYIDHIRQDRLSRMLANQLQEFEEKMLFIDDQQTQILVEIGHVIYQNLINQCMAEIHRFI